MQKVHIASSDKPVSLCSLDAVISVGYRDCHCSRACGFVVIDVKLGKNGELSEAVAERLEHDVGHIRDEAPEACTRCYEKTYAQKRRPELIVGLSFTSLLVLAVALSARQAPKRISAGPRPMQPCPRHRRAIVILVPRSGPRYAPRRHERYP